MQWKYFVGSSVGWCVFIWSKPRCISTFWSSSEGFLGLEVDVLIVSMKGKGEDKHACVCCEKMYKTLSRYCDKLMNLTEYFVHW